MHRSFMTHANAVINLHHLANDKVVIPTLCLSLILRIRKRRVLQVPAPTRAKASGTSTPTTAPHHMRLGRAHTRGLGLHDTSVA